MRTGKRWLAGIAAGGLAAGLISFTGGGVAQAATPNVFTAAGLSNFPATTQVVRTDDAAFRLLPVDAGNTVGNALVAGAPTPFGIQALSTGAGTDTVQVTYESIEGATPIVLSSDFAAPGAKENELAGVNDVWLVAGQNTTFATSNVNNNAYEVTATGGVGSIALSLGRDSTPGLYTLTIWSGADATNAISSSIYLSNAPASILWRPTGQTVQAGQNADFNATVVDDGGRPTYLKGGEFLRFTNAAITGGTSAAQSLANAPLTLPAPVGLNRDLTPTLINSTNARTVWGSPIVAGPTNVRALPPAATAQPGVYGLLATPNNLPGVVAATNTVTVVGPITTVAWPAASRAQQVQFPAVTGAFPADGGGSDYHYAFCAVPGTTPGAFDAAVGVKPVAGGTVAVPVTRDTIPLQDITGSTTLAGTYSIALYYRADGSDIVCNPVGNALAGMPATGSIALTTGRLTTFGGPIATITQTPAQLTVAPTSVSRVTVTAQDVAGRATLPLITGTADTLTYSSDAIGVATVSQAGPTEANINAGVLNYNVTGVAAGNTQVRTTSSNSSVAPAISQVGVAAAGATTAATSIGLSQPNVVEVTPVALQPFNRGFLANPTVTAFTFNVSGLQPGQTYPWTAAQTGGLTLSGTSGTITASATGTASQVINVTAGGPVDGDTVTFQVPGTGAVAAGAGANKQAIVEYDDPATDFQSPLPGQTFFATAGATVPVSVSVATQYGAVAGGSTVNIVNAAGTVVATAITNAQGEATLNVTAPASGFASFTVSGQTATLQPIPTVTFSVNTNTPTVTLPAGVTIGSNVVTRTVPSGGVVNTASGTITPITVVVNATGGANVTAVTLTGSDGVRFLTSNPDLAVGGAQPWNAGTATATIVTGGGVGTVWAYSTKSGAATVTAAVGGQTVNGNFSVTAGAARNLKVEAPSAITTSELGVLTMSLTDAFGNPVNATGMQVRIKDGSIGTFANGLRQTTVDFTGEGRAQVTVNASQAGKIEVIAGTVGFGQFGAAAGSPGVEFTASNAPAEVSINVTVAKGLLITNSGRDSRGGYFSGVASGFSAGETVNVRFKVYNKSTKKWSAWKAGGTVTLSTVVDSAGNRSFSGIIERGNALKVRVVKSGVNSEIVTIPAA